MPPELEPTPATPAAQAEAGSLTLLLREVLEKRDASLLGDLRKDILQLAAPERGPVADVLPTGDPATERASGIEISRDQPTDPLYRKLHRTTGGAYKDCRSPDLDHWNAEWIRGLALRDRTRQAVAVDRLTEIVGKRAVTTYSIGDVSGTDILDGSGGDLLPQPLSNVVEIARDLTSVLPGLVQSLTMTSATLRVPTATAFAAGMVAEGATSTGAGPAFASVLFKAQKLQAFAKLSIEMLADSAFNVVGLLGSRAGAAIGAVEDVQICTSNGTTPNITAPMSGADQTETTTTVLIYEDLVDLFFVPTKPYRAKGIWMGDDLTLSLLSQLLDGNGRPILNLASQMPAVVENAPGQIGTIFGKGVYEVPFADGLLMFGDPAGYGFARRAGITAAVSTEADFASDLVQFKFTERIDGNMLDAAAFAEFNDLASVA